MALTPRYQPAVDTLRCFRGVGTLSAMILLAEIVDSTGFADHGR